MAQLQIPFRKNGSQVGLHLCATQAEIDASINRECVYIIVHLLDKTLYLKPSQLGKQTREACLLQDQL